MPGGPSLARVDDNLLLQRRDTQLDATRWRHDPELDPEHDHTQVLAYALGDDFLVLFDDSNVDYVAHDRRQVVLKGR